MTNVETRTSVPTTVGDLPAVVTASAGAHGPLPGVVLVDGSGPGDVDDWGGWPDWVTDCGAVVLRHAKPGCGAPGDWMDQSLLDRAEESLAALDVLRRTPGVDPARVGLLGFSQGGWVAAAAAAQAPQGVGFVITVSGPAVGVEATERYRLRAGALAAGEDVDEVLAFYEAVLPPLRRGDVEKVVAASSAVDDRRWKPVLEGLYDHPPLVAFIARIIDHDPADDLAALSCPLLACFGASDTLVPVPESVAALAGVLNRDERSGVAVFPAANHGLFLSDPLDGIDRREQLAPGFLALLEGFLSGPVPYRAAPDGTA